jgi:hypothetical protein
MPWISRKRYLDLMDERETLRVINQRLSVQLDNERLRSDHYNRSSQAWFEGFEWMRGQLRFRDLKIKRALELVYAAIAGNTKTPTG